MDIHGDEFLTLLHMYGYYGGKEIDELFCMVALRKVKVDSVVYLFDVDSVLMSGVL